MFSLFIIFISNLAYGIVGPSIPSYQRPDSVCVIKYAYKTAPTEIVGVCSGVLVKKDTLLTAGHCLSQKDSQPVAVEILCPNGQTSKIKNQKRNPNYIDVNKSFDSARRQDLGFYTLQTPMNLNPMPVAKSFEETKKIIKTSSQCGLFGYGGRAPTSPNAFELQGGIVDPQSITFKEGLLWISSLHTYLTSMIVPGDSGGSFACRNSENEWVHLGQNSAMSYNYESLITPAFLARDFIPMENAPELSEDFRKASLLRSLFLKVDHLILEASLIEDNGTLLKKEASLLKKQLEEVSLKNTLNSEIAQTSALLNEIEDSLAQIYNLQFTENQTYPVVPLANIHSTDSFLLEPSKNSELTDSEKQRLSLYSTFNVGDNSANLFSIEKIEDSQAFGTLEVRAMTQHYGCVAMILCQKKILKNVKINLKDLRLSVF